MKKIYLLATTLLTTLAGATAGSLPEPTLIPEEGAILNVPNQIILTWDQLPLEVNSQAQCYDPETGVFEFPFLVNGEEYNPTGDGAVKVVGFPAYFNTTYNVWEFADEGIQATGLGINPALLSLPNEGMLTFTIEIPADIVKINGESNEPRTLTYNVVNFRNEYTVWPTKASSVLHIDMITISWDNNPITAVNRGEDAEPILYGPGAGPLKEVEDVLVMDNGSSSIILGEDYKTPGQMKVVIPANTYILETAGGTITNPTQIELTYNITPYALFPAQFHGLFCPGSSFFVYANESIEFTGDVADITVIDDFDRKIATVSAANNVFFDGNPAVEFVFSEPVTVKDNTQVRATIPGGSLVINGDPHTSALSWQFNFYAEPRVTPEEGEVTELKNFKLNWGHTPTITKFEDIYPTLTFQGTELNLAPYAKISEQDGKKDEMIGGSTTSFTFLEIDLPEALTEPGEYELRIPADYVTFLDYWNEGNPEMLITYVIPGDDESEDPGDDDDPNGAVEGIAADNAPAIIYNLQGLKVDNPSKGLYIINGKKVYIK